MTPNGDPFNLERFVMEQDRLPFQEAMSQLRRGAKTGHWIWFIFPQIRGLGRSQSSLFFGIGSLEEAEAYVQHPILGPRLIEATEELLKHVHVGVAGVVGDLDAMKVRSSLTLFQATSQGEAFSLALQNLFNGVECEQTRTFLS